jgi:nucleoside-diphosphate-sugar epimerase
MARAIEWAAGRRSSGGGHFVAVNVGRDDWNYNIRQLAEACAEVIGKVEVSINRHAMPDKRSYRVDFSRFRELAPKHQPLFTLENAIRDLQAGLLAMDFAKVDFRETWFMRLKVLAAHIEAGRLNEELSWVG